MTMAKNSSQRAAHEASTKATHRLEALQLEKSFKKRCVVKNVNFRVASGEIVGLLGPNGAGKTTSFYMMVGLIHPDRGSILFDGKNITALAMHTRARLGIGYLPQEPSIFRKLSVEDNILAILQLRNDLTREQKQKTLESLLEAFHLRALRKNLGLSLSGGERRRAEIARALALNPKFILLDEPFAGIDPLSVMDINRIILQLQQQGIGIVITDHNVRETLSICQRSYIVNEGEILAQGNCEQILANDKVRRVYLGEHFSL